MDLLLTFTLLVMLFIFIQDIKYRAVYWWLFPLLFILLALLGGGLHQLSETTEKFISNLAFLTLQLFLLMIYFAIRHKKIINITKAYLGLGDILFLLVIGIYLSFLNFVLFYVASLMLIIIFELIKSKLLSSRNKKIPLAGYQSLFLCAYILVDQFTVRLNLTNDLWLLPFLNNIV
ncbi:hypothetical protein GM921_00735 [Pedobacter sp. LMG 31464]|uniref:Type IV leader peptidase family protein n=1 Tax=Pedobacter planticolens TaxID=2679964 RepID=A0A923DVU6_9SPHI|nr:hypothetical protein [Pedobacter planticolens]MBB2143996.1 hypothetical protein [Pedobacter planticolens]